MELPLPDYSSGTLYSFSMTVPSMDEGEICHNLLSQIKDSIRKLDKEYVKKVQDAQDHLDYIKEMVGKLIRGETIYFSFSSLCKFPLYEADFGWGKPIWVGSATLASMHGVIFQDIISSDGIEAWINLKEEDMAKFDCDKELLGFITLKNC
ncbi:hypothetical protein QUC31_014111 [Theobroma cacao]|uniref:HXXXD-type acyl-transferase family protein, putative n=1 Tax=Theobroma cacao TaxID=3641 RepID=A0A061E763_THECC|nr:HXXXD-type acyl-transferase family protein, putative [Theobroma cacao]